MTLINLVTHTAAICNTTYNSIKSVLIVNFMCFDSQFYQPISILLSIHDLFSVSLVNVAVSIVHFAVSIANLLISLCGKIS